MEAYEGKAETAKRENGSDWRYQERFRKRHREEFAVGEEVRVARRENLGIETKGLKGRFVRKGVVKEVRDGDSYLVEKDDGRIVKKRDYDMKAAGSVAEYQPSDAKAGVGDERIISVG